ncbi:MAG: S8 family serine peptidase, partial [Thermoanaerobaculia bacterium]
DTGDVEHATHVAGTMIASGANAPAKGMAPAATLHQFSARGDEVLNRKEALPTFGSSVDNNSWGYVLGWCNPPSCEGWVWDDTEEYYGAYDVAYTAPLDRITRSTNVLFVHSAGNDAEKRGPLAVPYAHQHTDDAGDLITGTFCYSANGSGTDCPAPACTAGEQFCETKRHPETIAELPSPYGSVGLTASAKNIIAVGAVDSLETIAGFSSRGPARDGRVKPDLVARGVAVFSTRPNGLYGNKQGTSMSAPAVTAMAGLLTQQWRRTFAGANPTPAVLKTLLIAGAEDLGNAGPDYTYGYGLTNAKNSVDLVLADGGVGRRVKRGSLAHGASFETTVTVGGTQNLRVVLGWSDPEVIIFPQDGLATSALVNDLDVEVIGPGGETILPYILDRTQPTQAASRGVNTIDNTEMLEIANAGSGTYRIVVTGSRITAEAPQAFVLVTNAEMEATAPPCTDIAEPNDSYATAMSLPRTTQTAGKTCQAGDVDFFTFTTNKTGTISVDVSSADTQLRAILSGAGTSPVIIEVLPGQSRTLTATSSSADAMPFFLRIEATGAIGATGAYTVTADFPVDLGSRRRAVRR